MKNLCLKTGLCVAILALILLSSFIIFSPTEDNTTYIVVDDVHGMLNGAGTEDADANRVAAPKRLPEKIKVSTSSITFKGRTVPQSAEVSVVIRRIMPTQPQGPIVVQAQKSIAHNATAGYQLPLGITQLTVNVWYNIEHKFKHKNGQLIVQKGQIMRVSASNVPNTH